MRYAFAGLLALLLLLTPVPGEPPPEHLGLEIRALETENGLTLIHEHDTSSRVSVVQFFIRGGQRAEPESKAGLSYLTTRLTLEIPDQNKAQRLMDQATRIYMACREDFSFVTVSCLTENLEDSLKLASEIMLRPLFSGIRIDRIKELMEHQSKTDQDETANQAHEVFMAAFFRDTPYARSVYGDEASRKNINKDDINWFYRNFFTAAAMTVVISTDLDSTAVQNLFNTYYGALPPGESVELPSFESAEPVKRDIFEAKDATQSFVSCGYALDLKTPRSYVLGYLVDFLLGRGIQSRLWDLRIKRQLAYSVQSRLTFASQASLLEAFLETEHANAEKARAALKDTLDTLHEQGIDQAELDMTKNYAAAQMLRDNENKENRSRSLAFYLTQGFGADFLERFFVELDAVTLEEINGFIRASLSPDKAVFVVIGPAEAAERPKR